MLLNIDVDVLHTGALGITIMKYPIRHTNLVTTNISHCDSEIKYF